MKKLVIALITAGLFTGGPAKAAETTLDYCAEVGEMAGLTMLYRKWAFTREEAETNLRRHIAQELSGNDAAAMLESIPELMDTAWDIHATPFSDLSVNSTKKFSEWWEYKCLWEVDNE